MDVHGITVVASHWVELGLSGSDETPRVLVKFAERDGRTVVTCLVILGEALTSATFRAIPIGRAESLLNQVGPDLGVELPFDQHMQKEFTELGALFPEEFATIDTALDSFQRKSVKPVEVKRGVTGRKPLTRPDGTDPEGFSRRVARRTRKRSPPRRTPRRCLPMKPGCP